MSLLSAILKVADETNINDLKVQFKDVHKRTAFFIDSVKNFTTDVKEILVARFVDYIPVKSLEYINFFERRLKLQAEQKELQLIVDQFSESGSSHLKFKCLYDDFVSTSNRLALVCDLGMCCKDLEVSCRLIERRKYKQAVELLNKMTAILNQKTNLSDLKNLITSMKDIVTFKHATCLNKIIEQWRDRLKWSHTPTNKGNMIILEMNVCDPENLQEILNALSTSKRINVELQRFAEFFTATILPALLTKKCQINITRNLNNIALEIEYADLKKKQKVSFREVLHNLTVFFETVQFNMDCKWEDDQTLFSIFGQIVGKNFFHSLKENCLDTMLPTDENMTESYLNVAIEIEKFNSYLCEIRFVNEEASPLAVFAKNSASLICEKKCEMLLSQARDLMKSNLQKDIVEITADTLDICIDEIKMLEKDYQDGDVTDCPYLFPSCSVSLSAQKLLQLVVDELEAAHNSAPMVANQIIITVRKIFELYYTLVSKYHEDELNNNALDLALFYNNCQYLSHGLIGHPWSKTFSREFSARLSLVLADQAHNMRLAAITKLASFIRKERHFIKETISNSELSRLESISSLSTSTDVAIFSCLERLGKLSRLWRPVLPRDTFHKTLGNLVSCLSQALVDCVVQVKEKIIGEGLALAISDAYQPVLEMVPTFFDEVLDADHFSRHWSRLVEFSAILRLSMTSVAERWRKQDGRLCALYSCEEVKHFIRIAFPSSIAKSKVLDAIH